MIEADGAAPDPSRMSQRAGRTARGGDRTVLSSPRIRRMQMAHFLMFDVGSALGAAAALAALPVLRPTDLDLGVAATLWLATGLAITVGYHRLFSHRAFQCGRRVKIGLLVLGAMAARGPMLSWAAMHRRHHELSDRPGDLHSPNLHAGAGGRLRGWLHAHALWMMRHDYPNVALYVGDLMQDRDVLRWNRRYYPLVALGLVGPAVVGFCATGAPAGALAGFLWGGALRLFCVAQAMNLINSLTHMVGGRPFRARDESSNLGWACLITWGESWHNNHHAFPWSAAFGLTPGQLDPGYWAIRALQAFGLAWEARRPAASQLAARRADAESPGAERAA